MMARTNIMDFSLPISIFFVYTSNAVLLQGLLAVFLIFFCGTAILAVFSRAGSPCHACSGKIGE